MNARFAQLLRLAWADLRRDGLLSSCSILMLAASLAPLLTLHGLENGVIGALINRMDRDPAMRLIIPEVTGGHRYDAAWFKDVGSWPEVEFVIPNTRAIAGLVDLVAGNEASGEPVQVSLLPTAAGDPVLATTTPPTATDAVVLSSSAARKLKVAPDANVTAVIERVREGLSERILVVLKVAAVLPAERTDGESAFASLAFVEAVQAWRDGHAVAAMGWKGDAEAAPTTDYPLFRVYARSIRDVAAVTGRLGQQGIALYTRDRELASALGLQHNLRAVLAIISGLAAFGYAVAMIALQIATVRRKRREYAVLKLIGYGRRWLMTLPAIEALMLSAGGIVLAFAFYELAAAAIQWRFASQFEAGARAASLDPMRGAAIVALAFLVSLLPAFMAGGAVAAIDPGDELRDV